MYQNVISSSYPNLSTSLYICTNGNFKCHCIFVTLPQMVFLLFLVCNLSSMLILNDVLPAAGSPTLCTFLFWSLWWYYLSHVQLAHIGKVQTSAVLSVYQLKTVFWSENFQLVMLPDSTLFFRYEIKDSFVSSSSTVASK